METVETREVGSLRVRLCIDPDPIEPDWDDPSAAEMQAWREGEVYGWMVEELTSVVWNVANLAETRTTWKSIESCWGYYGDPERALADGVDTAQWIESNRA